MIVACEGITSAAHGTVPQPPVASVTIVLNSPSLTVGQTTQAVSTLRDNAGNVLTGRAVTWESSNASVATVSTTGLVTARTPGSATISARSESMTGSAPLLVGASSPPQTFGGDEPTFEPGSDVALLNEGFEGFDDKAALLTYNWTLQRYVYAGGSNIEFPSSGGGHSSAKAIRINYPVSETYNDKEAVLEANVIGGSTQGKFLVVEYWVRTKPGYPWRRAGAKDEAGAGEKTLIWNAGSGTVPRFVMGGGLMPAGTFWDGKYNHGWPASGLGIVVSADGNVGGTGTFWYFQNMNGAARDPNGYMNDGNWHLWKVKLTPGTFQNRTGGDGAIEIWIDGVKVVEYIGSDPSRPEYNQVVVPLLRMNAMQNVQIGGPFNGGPSPAQGPQWKDYDDVWIWVRP